MRVVTAIILLIMIPSLCLAGPVARRAMGVVKGPHQTLVTISSTDTFYDIPSTWYQDEEKTVTGAIATLYAPGGGGECCAGVAGSAGDKVELALIPAAYALTIGTGGQGGDYYGEGSTGGTGYVAGTDGAENDGAGGGSTAVVGYYDEILKAAAKGGDGTVAGSGGGTSSGGTITVGGGSPGGAAGAAGSNNGITGTAGKIELRYYQ